ncbi:UNVERIFIED_CONTAM: hypothetical protein FKN15_064420 [Acipenser sinensis]
MGNRDYLFKVLVIGDREVGKTSLVQRYVNDKFSKHYKSTVGVDFAVKVIQRSDTETVRLQLWDIAGQERFASMTRIYYKEASGCFIMFDVMNPTTLNNSLKWKQDLDSKVMRADGSPVPCMLLANKCDLSPWEVTHESIDQFSIKNGFAGWVETSAKDNKNINEAASALIEKMMMQPSVDPQSQGGHIKLDAVPKGEYKQGCC